MSKDDDHSSDSTTSVTSSDSSSSSSSSESLSQRLKAVLETESNQKCAECPERDPTWACLLVNPIDESGPRVGVFCCYKCNAYLAQLGKDVCEVKSTRAVAHNCKKEEKALSLL